MRAGPSMLVALVVIGATAESSHVTPLQKLIEMLDGMVAKGKVEKQVEEVEFAKYHEWCDGVRATRTSSIKKGSDQIDQLNADIAKATSDAEVLDSEIKDLESASAKAEVEAASATSLRDKEHDDYTAQHKDLSESIDACGRAIQTLNARSADVPQSLMQVQSLPLIPAHAKAVLKSFLVLHSSSTSAVGAPEANAYEFQSGGVVSILEKLEGKFKEQLLALEKAEMSAKGNFQLLLQQLTDDIAADKKTAAAKTESKASKLKDAEVAKGDLAVAEATKKEDEKVLADTAAECLKESEMFEANQVTRAGEVKAIEQAIEILSSEAVKGNAETHLPAAALLQAVAKGAKGGALVQMQGAAEWDPDVRRKAVELLQARAKKLKSSYLALAATRVAEDPFAKVKKMIKDLITKLTEQANAEADSHAFCTTELATNKQTRENKAAEVEDLTAHLEQLTASSSQLSAEITELSDAIAEIKGQQMEATNNRETEHKANAQTVADAKEAQLAVEKATKILREFYSSMAESSLLQGAQGAQALGQAMTRIALDPYKGQQDTTTGIFGMLEVVMSDFARLESETSTAEETAAAAYEKFMNEANESVSVKEAEVEHKTNKRQLTDEEAGETKKELELTHAELDKTLDYYDKLKAQCLDTGLSYQERWNMRQEEIQSLTEALEILEQSDVH